MAVMRLWARSDLRRRWRSVALLIVVVTLATATVLTAFAGARRGASVRTRLADRTLPATAAVLPNTPGFDWAPVAKLPEVAALGRFVVDYSLAIKGVPGSEQSVGFPPADDATMSTIERPVVHRGRLFDPTRADEVVVTRKFARSFGLDVGDHVSLRLPTEEELMGNQESGTFHGPLIRTTIVGVISSPWFADTVASPGGLALSPGLAARYPDLVLGDQSNPENPAFVNALVRLKGGEADLPRFRRDLARITGRDDIDVWNLPEKERDAQRTLRFEALCLVGFGLAALAAACFLGGQAIGRHTGAAVDELRGAEAFGLTPRQVIVDAAVVPALAGAVGVVLAVPLVWVASSRFPLGAAGLVEPSPGRSLDLAVVGPGAVVAFALVAATALATAWRSRRARDRAGSRSAVADLAARGDWPVPMAIGTRWALDPGRGRSAVPVRPALIGAIVGLAGITGAFTFATAVRDAAGNPERFGQNYDAAAFLGIGGQDFAPVPQLISALRARPEVTGVVRARNAVVTDPSGKSSVSLYTTTSAPKRVPILLTDGERPRSPHEIVLAPRSASALHVGVGDRVELVGNRGRSSFLVTGIGFVPSGPHNGYADGGWVTPGGYDSIVDGFKFDIALVQTRPGTSLPGLSRSLAEDDPALTGVGLGPPDPLEEVAVIRDVEVLPVALGAFLVLLALAAVGHALLSSVSRRSGDLAVLRVLGLTPWQCRAVVVTQSTLIGLLGLAVGVPIGIVIGRLAWRAVAGYTPLAYVAPFAGIEVLLTIPAALLAANLLGLWPGHRASRLRIHHVLRTE